MGGHQDRLGTNAQGRLKKKAHTSMAAASMCDTGGTQITCRCIEQRASTSGKGQLYTWSIEQQAASGKGQLYTAVLIN
eukprot:COSAG06_NODE_253_length_19061_cov_33.083114_17_plen_78_part_00